ncbi:protein-export chaperone SecB [Hydromonas duriensis]|uniref:Protein-export protein SecB n=1 Tax=Hydromonas duriensis TaxID=1527608 RepID=A0A4R6Y814_9BURK|nr:protein translocase subunit secB [Hydromonas duriensis]
MTDQAQPTFDLRRVYLKDASLEMPNAPAVFLEGEAPQVAVEVSTEHTQLDTSAYEVEVSVTLTARLNDKVFFLIEAKQAGIFEIANLPDEQLEPVLHIVCPSMLYPYLRANVADLLTRATLPPLHLTEVNFEQFYQDKIGTAAPATTVQ